MNHHKERMQMTGGREVPWCALCFRKEVRWLQASIAKVEEEYRLSRVM